MFIFAVSYGWITWFCYYSKIIITHTFIKRRNPTCRSKALNKKSKKIYFLMFLDLAQK